MANESKEPEYNVTMLSPEDAKVFFDALDNPAEPNEKLKRTFQQYIERTASDVQGYPRVLQHKTENRYVLIVLNKRGNANPSTITVFLKLGNEWVSVVSMIENNMRKMSATLACEVGFGPAKEMLTAHNLPHDHPLWDLNHQNPWKD